MVAQCQTRLDVASDSRTIRGEEVETRRNSFLHFAQTVFLLSLPELAAETDSEPKRGADEPDDGEEHGIRRRFQIEEAERKSGIENKKVVASLPKQCDLEVPGVERHAI